MKRILIIEDDNDILDVLKTILSTHDYEVQGVNRTDDIFALINSYTPDLILTDYLLFGINGGKICQLIKSNKDTCHIPVVLISAYKDLAMSLGNFGFDAFIEKPFTIGKLLNTIKLCLDTTEDH